MFRILYYKWIKVKSKANAPEEMMVVGRSVNREAHYLDASIPAQAKLVMAEISKKFLSGHN